MGLDTVLKARTAPEGESLGLPFAANTHLMLVADRVSHAFLEVNNAAVQQYGYSQQEFLNMTTLSRSVLRRTYQNCFGKRSIRDRKAQAQQRSGATKLRTGSSSRLRLRAGS